MPERIMLKAITADEHIILHTVTNTGKKSRQFYVRRIELAELQSKDYIVVKDYAFAEFAHDRFNDTLLIKFYWMNLSGLDGFKGFVQRVTVNFSDFMDFINSGITEYKALSIPELYAPKLTFASSRNLHEIVTDKLLRRKLSKFLRDNFKWGSTEIKLFDDFVPYSFYFREYRNGTNGMCGGLILHGQTDMSKAYYSIHT